MAIGSLNEQKQQNCITKSPLCDSLELVQFGGGGSTESNCTRDQVKVCILTEQSRCTREHRLVATYQWSPLECGHWYRPVRRDELSNCSPTSGCIYQRISTQVDNKCAMLV